MSTAAASNEWSRERGNLMVGNRARLALCALLVASVVAVVGVGTASAVPVASPVISGQVTDLDGNSLANAHVHLWRNTLPGNPWFDAADASTDSSGNYTISYDNGYLNNGSPGFAGDYALLIEGPDAYYRPQWWSGIPGFFARPDIWQLNWQATNLAAHFTLSSGTQMTGADAALEPYQGTIECTVRDAESGLPVPGVKVTLYHFDTVTVGAAPHLQDVVFTDGDGRFIYPADPTLAAGSWWTLLMEKTGDRKAWLGGKAYQSGVAAATQAAAAGVTHLQVASAAVRTIEATMQPVELKLTIKRSPSASSITHTRKSGVAKFTLSAVLTDARGFVMGGPVWLQKSTTGKTWTTLYKLKTNSSGKASKSLSIKKKGTTYYRWHAPETLWDEVSSTTKQKVVIK